jgi:hypothetical protein
MEPDAGRQWLLALATVSTDALDALAAPADGVREVKKPGVLRGKVTCPDCQSSISRVLPYYDAHRRNVRKRQCECGTVYQTTETATHVLSRKPQAIADPAANGHHT